MSTENKSLNAIFFIGAAIGVLIFASVVSGVKKNVPLPALAKLETSIAYPEKFLGKEDPDFPALLAMIDKHKGIPEEMRPQVRGITQTQNIVYLALEEEGQYRWVAPWDEVKTWK